MSLQVSLSGIGQNILFSICVKQELEMVNMGRWLVYIHFPFCSLHQITRETGRLELAFASCNYPKSCHRGMTTPLPNCTAT